MFDRDGTPVLDIKPYVPHYDSVGYHPQCPPSSSSSTRLPTWVSTGLEKRRPVYLTTLAHHQLYHLVHSNTLEFYKQEPPPNNNNTSDPKNKKKEGDDNDNDNVNVNVNDAYENIVSCIQEVLSVDVRSSFQTRKARKGASQADRALKLSTPKDTSSSVSFPTTSMESLCTQQLDNMLLHFSVQEVSSSSDSIATTTKEYSAAKGSGCDDIVMVHSIDYISKKGIIETIVLEPTTEIHKEEKEEAIYKEVWDCLKDSLVLEETQHVTEIGYPSKTSLEDNAILDTLDNSKSSDKLKVQGDTLTSTDNQESSPTMEEQVPKNVQSKDSLSTNSKIISGPTNDTSTFSLPQFPTSRNTNTISSIPSKHSTLATAQSYTDLYSKPADEKQTILVDPIVQDHDDYNKLQNFWKQRAGSNKIKMTPPGDR